MVGLLEEYLAVIRSPQTRVVYLGALKRLHKDPNQLVEMAMNDKRSLERSLTKFILRERDRVSPTHTNQPILALRSFLKFHDIDFKWGKISAAMPKSKFVARDRAPKLTEIRKAISFADPRGRMIFLILASSGIRLGALEGLRLSSVVNLDHGLAKLRIYQGSAEEYWAYITPEARNAVEHYLEMRRQIGEDLTPESPLLRDKWNYDTRPGLQDPTVARMLRIGSISSIVSDIWDRAGILKISRGIGHTGRRHEFKQVHGFRKFFKTQATKKLSTEDVEVLMGHIVNYYKPTDEHLEEEYRKALSVLTISESEEVKRKSVEEMSIVQEKYAGLARTVLQLQAEMTALKSGQ